MPDFSLADLSPLHWAAIFLALMSSAALLLRFTAGPEFANHSPYGLSDEPVMIFEGEQLVDCSATARPLLVGLGETPNWSAIVRRFGHRFPGLPRSPDLVPVGEPITLSSLRGEDVCLDCTRFDGLLHLRIRKLQDAYQENSAVDDVALLREGLTNAPYPIWVTEIDGSPVWSNKAYDRLTEKISSGAKEGRTPTALFTSALDGKSDGTPVRVSYGQGAETDLFWLDVTRVRLDGLLIYYATEVTPVVKAEIAQRNFVQTLAKTFAQLSIGLAIFDHRRQLILFNPALLDLTNLPVDFLSARPQLLSVFDRLRDLRIMPEPKSYASWREQMADLVRDASESGYMETWTLPSGSTYRITGRPHPDGAVAFLFEDVSSEVSLTRRFRSDVRLGSSVLDALEDALIVFDTSETAAFCNRSYRRLWKTDPDATFANFMLRDAIRAWRQECEPGQSFDTMERQLKEPERSGKWYLRMRGMAPNEGLLCQFDRLPNGATLVRFRSTTITPQDRTEVNLFLSA